MHSAQLFNLLLVFLIVSSAVLIAHKFRFCAIPFLILLGALFGPHAPQHSSFSFRLVENTESLALLSQLGLLFLLLYLGLEFSAGRVIERGAVILKSGCVYVGLNFLRGLALGWVIFRSWPEALVVAGITTVSSSAIVTKLLVELKRSANPETELILGILVFEDAFVAVYLSLLSAYLYSAGASLYAGLLAGLVTLVFVLGVLFLGRFIAPWLDRRLGFKSGEPLIMVVFTLLLAVAWLAGEVGVTEAVAALLLGLVLAETSHARRLVQLVTPLRDLFGGVFFFTFGMEIDYRQFAPVAGLAGVAAAVTVAGNFLAGMLSAWLGGYRGRAAVNVAATIIARGEFAIIAAELAGPALGGGLMAPLAALYVLILAFVNPVLAKRTRQIHQGLEVVKELFWRRQGPRLTGK
ncbi:cation:proton antiporter [Desulfovirgula thermocuniculi]|uniref:cation:proton antiporter n=1 Tax=Desulfovirgula thermocuniculi TaxID=348842 RepID=UPI0004115D00|nr:cation:proton antiporter [Desulfovirgula thermocuniculi]